MAYIALPTWFKASTCTPQLVASQRMHASPFGGSQQVQDMLNDVWRFDVGLPVRRHADAAALEAWLNSFRGLVNHTTLHHLVRPLPLGTARGTQTLNASAAQGASSIQIADVSPATGTYLAGDMIGVGGLLLQVADNATASGGVVTVNLVNRLRAALTSGDPVTYNKPTADFRLLDGGPVQYVPGMAQAAALSFVEKV
jgi:hypothetical protein